MSYITTVTGIHFYPLNPNPKDIDIEDIAHALSLICRANGHFRHFYSVAQHCIACAEEAIERGYSPEVILGCLLHDASEAYLCDVTRPVKKHIPQYLQAEEKLQEVIWKRFIGRELTDAEKKLIFEINEDYRKLQGSYTCEYQDPQEVKSRFIQMATLDIAVDRLLEDDYWIIDILPSQIPIEKQAEYRALTDECFESGKVAQLHRRYADILTMINSRFKTAMLCMPEDEWTISPDDVAVKDAVIHHTERGCVDLLLPEEETLISLRCSHPSYGTRVCGFAAARRGNADFSASGGFIHNRLSPDRGAPFPAAAGGIRIRFLYLANSSNRANQEIRKLSK